MTRAEARAAFDKVLAPLQRGKDHACQAVTFGRFVKDEYLTLKSRVWKGSTRSTTEQLICTHLLPGLGKRALASITRKELQALLDAKADADLSESVVAHLRWQLEAIFEMAQADGLTLTNPASALVIPKCKPAPPKTVIDVATIQRAQSVLQVRERLAFRLCTAEGMRPGEAMALQWGDIREDGIHIERRLYRGVIDTPKTRRSQRLIPPTAGTKALLAEYREMARDTSPAAWVFASETGTTPVSYSNLFRRHIQPALKTIGLDHVNFQAMRRSWVTAFAAVERDPNVRAQLAGHSVDVSENTYRQPVVEVLDQAMSKVSDLIQ